MKRLLTAALAAVSFAMPVSAKVDAGTVHLLQTLEEYGITIEYNPAHCSNGYAGRYTTEKVMTLCYKGQPTAFDFDTVRHETMHVLQHCAALRRGDDRGIVPLAINPTERNQWVSQVLRSGQIDQIKENYPERAHQVELEAFAAAAHYDSYQLASLVKSWCFK